MESKSNEQKLIEAIRWNNRIEALVAIKEGASIHAKDEHGDDVVLLAAALNHWIIVDDLLHCGANVEAHTASGGNRLMHYAAANGEWAAICRLIHFKASVNIVNNFGDTPLDVAIRNNHHRIIEFLQQNDARAKSEMHHIRDVGLKIARESTIARFGEEYACFCEHGLSRHRNNGGRCEEIIRKVNEYEELCTCDTFADIWGREVPTRIYEHRGSFDD